MNIFLAGHMGIDCPQEYIKFKSKYTLQTFYDCKRWEKDRQKQVITAPKTFFLDSGAFTFMNSGVKVDWNEYLQQYAKFINQYNIQYFFELDLDTVIGVEQTKKMTDRLERLTKRQCIPVFHACRGLKRWREMCKEYPYVAIGASGITEECRWVKNDKLLQQMVRIAHQNGAKVHGLGYTRLSNLNDTVIPFDSVDSSACLSGGRFATMYKFTGTRLISKSIKGRSPGYKILNRHNIREWIKMQYYKSGDKYEQGTNDV
nr:MAG TPA: Queuine tRNA-ribosyltransferase [Caudoviricetes sp.]